MNHDTEVVERPVMNESPFPRTSLQNSEKKVFGEGLSKCQPICILAM